jgi:hypothetical protein
VRSTRASLVTVAFLLSVAIALQVWRDRGWTPHEPATPVLWLPNAHLVKHAALGFDALAADIYWIRAVVYFGRQRLSTRPDKTYDLLYPLLTLVTTLDPRFTVAYRFGALFLTEPSPGGPNRPDQAITLLKNGVLQNPDRWEYMHDIGFVYAWSHRDYEEAARWFERASNVPGAPLWMKATAASMVVRGGDRVSARQLWTQLRDSTDVEWFRNTADIHLAQFDALDEIDRLNQIVWRHKADTGRMPQGWEELVSAGVLRAPPRDPARVPYELNQANEDVRLSPQSPLWPLPVGYGPATR